jgi:hypothetical protein
MVYEVAPAGKFPPAEVIVGAEGGRVAAKVGLAPTTATAIRLVNIIEKSIFFILCLYIIIIN